MKKNTSNPPRVIMSPKKTAKSYNLTILHFIGKMWEMKFNNNIYYY